VRFLSDEWMDELDRAGQQVEVPGEVDLVIEHEIVDGDRTVRFHVAFADGTIRVRPGPAPTATVRFHQDAATAWAVLTGEGSAQRAFMAGDLRVGGDLRALLAQASVLGGLDDAFAAVRGRTEPPEGSDA
jgi:alkyl sulfatase BDS1-like metallo-beta-lactamase superfamily hydrolase